MKTLVLIACIAVVLFLVLLVYGVYETKKEIERMHKQRCARRAPFEHDLSIYKTPRATACTADFRSRSRSRDTSLDPLVMAAAVSVTDSSGSSGSYSGGYSSGCSSSSSSSCSSSSSSSSSD